jgi:hypothetical protein
MRNAAGIRRRRRLLVAPEESGDDEDFVLLEDDAHDEDTDHDDIDDDDGGHAPVALQHGTQMLDNHRNRNSRQYNGTWTLTRLYVIISAVLASLAVLAAPQEQGLVETVLLWNAAVTNSSDQQTHRPWSHQQIHHQDTVWFKTLWWTSTGTSSSSSPSSSSTGTSSSSSPSSSPQQQQLSDTSTTPSAANNNLKVPVWKRWMGQPTADSTAQTMDPTLLSSWTIWLDPAILQALATGALSPDTVTDLLDKILTSSVRLLVIANWLLAITCQLHTVTAVWFLGQSVVTGDLLQPRTERLGGFLVFKLLLVSAVVAPDTLDLLILLSWYTVLSFLRSLALLCHTRTELTALRGHAVATAQAAGVWQLLVTVLCADFVAAAICVALFHQAGIGMVLLLCADCASTAVDCVSFLLQHVTTVLDSKHAAAVGRLEEERLQALQQQSAAAVEINEQEQEQDAYETQQHLPEVAAADRRVQLLEQLHTRRMAILDTAVFWLQLLTHAITVAHFLHIWSLHGVQFTLIDGVLALHLHSALSSASKKIAERRNLYRIARDLDGMFDDASELDLRKAVQTGDVCCICLGTMSTGSVKKVGCGHLYHTTCLREVVERARSIEAARCPLCRASVLDGRQQGSGVGGPAGGGVGRNNTGVVANVALDNIPPARDAAVQGGAGGGGERALFRFSTEGILPAWLPLPAFSFEVVRRPPTALEPFVDNNGSNAGPTNAAGNNNAAQVQAENPNEPHQQQQQSLIRRFLVLVGAIPMSPEEEAAAMEQLVDMFPQYDRSDMMRDLRERRSSEAVAEAILAGSFAALPRGAASNWPDPPAVEGR